jgi:plasmid maintenance system antidote protein VapI
LKPQTYDLAAKLDALGWSQTQLAERISVHPNTISRWTTGKAEITGPARAYVDLAMKVKALL